MSQLLYCQIPLLVCTISIPYINHDVKLLIVLKLVKLAESTVLRNMWSVLIINQRYIGLLIAMLLVRLYANDTSLLSNVPNMNDAIDQSKEFFHKLYHLCVANTLSINRDKIVIILYGK